MHTLDPKLSKRPSPRVFFSYTHDSLEHQSRVRVLAHRLRQDGIEVRSDQDERVPSEGWLAWTRQQLGEADVVLTICTEAYNHRNRGPEAVERGQGMSWGEAVLADLLFQPSQKYTLIPAVFEATDTEHIPSQLRGATWFHVGTEEGYERLVRFLTRNPKTEAGAPSTAASSNEEIRRRLGEDFEAAYLLKDQLLLDEGSTIPVDEKIVDLKRRLRSIQQLLPGDNLMHGRFQLLEPVGRGGFGTVWKAWDEQQTELVAVKILHGQFAQDRSRRERFFRGARVMAQIPHQGIARILVQEVEDEGHSFFVMEHVEGGDFRRAVLEQRLGGSDALEIVLQVGNALAFAHAHGVVHRDIKPANILLTENLRPKLTDFDLVRTADNTGGTRTGGLGTFVYTAPESMLDASRADPRADIYSLAMTAAFAIHGAELPPAALFEPQTFLEELNCSRNVKAAVEKAMARKAEDRFDSIEEFLEALVSGPIVAQRKTLATQSASTELLAFCRSIPWAETFLQTLHRDDVAVTLCEEAENDCWHLRLRLPERIRNLYGLAPQALLLAATSQVQGGDLLRARERLYQERFELDLDLLLVVDGEHELTPRLQQISYGEEPWIPWEWNGTNFEPLDRTLPNHLPTNDIFRRTDPVTGLQFVGREGLITELSKALMACRAIGIFGLRKSGKTSVMRAVTDRLDPESSPRLLPTRTRDTPKPSKSPLLVAWLDCQNAMERELEPLAERLVRALAKRLKQEDPTLTARLTPEGNALDRLDSLLEHALERARVPICLVLDEYDWLFAGGRGEPPIAGLENLFGLFRAHAQATGRLVLAVIGRDPQALDFPRMGGRSNPVLHWFDRHWLGPMSKEDADQLLVGLGRRVLLDVEPRTADLARLWTGGFPLLHRRFGSALLKLSRTDGNEAAHTPTDPFREQALDLFLDDDEPMNTCREVFDLLTERHPEAASLLRRLGSDHRGMDATSWQQPAARVLRRLGLLTGSHQDPAVPELFRWYVRTFTPDLQEHWVQAQ